ncbi:hypothetical protein [Mycolicibacterium thermoresistibile]
MSISTDDVRRLLAADSADATLVMVEGRVEVISAGQLADPNYRGALEVITRRDLQNRIGAGEPSERELAEQAAALETALDELGG